MAVANTHIVSFPDVIVPKYDSDDGTTRSDTIGFTDQLRTVHHPMDVAEVVGGNVFHTVFPQVYTEFLTGITVTSDIMLPSLGMEIGIDNIRADLVLASLGMEVDLSVGINVSADIIMPGLSVDATVGATVGVVADLVMPSLGVQATVVPGVGLSADLLLPVLGMSATTGESVSVSTDMVFPTLVISGSFTVSGDTDEILLTNKRGGDNWETFA